MKLTYGEQVERILAGLFVDGRPAPTLAQVASAYPFGRSDKHLASLWLEKVSSARKAHNPKGRTRNAR